VRRPHPRRSIEAPSRRWRCGAAALIAVLLCTACGKKGPPLPPLVKLPVAPENLTIARRGDSVGLDFVVPSANTDGTRPANVSRAEVYAITAPQDAVAPLTDLQLLKLATKVGGVDVKAPRDPNATADVDDPADEVEPPEGPGLDQGALGHLEEPLTGEAMTPVAIPKDKKAPALPAGDRGERPLLGPPPNTLTRIYAAVGTSPRGRKGPLSKRIVVPLAPPPPAPLAAKMTYDESGVTVTWSVIADSEAVPPPGENEPEVLPSRNIGASRPAITFNVYDVSNPAVAEKLTKTPLTELKYLDNRMEWGQERCYTVRTAETVGSFSVESEAPPPACETLVDKFPPSAPKGAAGIASEGAINLIWEPNTEKDLAGYIVMRAAAPSEDLQPVTPAPIQETSFKDNVQSGVQYIYVVTAVDRAGNASAASARVVETAR
jgi:hypothetical protein